MKAFRAGVFYAVLFAACSNTADTPGIQPPRSPVDETLRDEFDAPLGPAELLDNRFRMFSSADPEVWSLVPIFPQGNADFGNFLADCRKTPGPDPLTFVSHDAVACPSFIDGLVLAHAAGPGAVGRIWMTALDILTGRQWETERLQVYVDGAATPAIDVTLADIALGIEPFQGTWAGIRSGSLVSYLPLRFEHELWITLANTQKKLYYYQVDIVEGELPEASTVNTVNLGEEKPVTTSSSIYAADGAGAPAVLRLRAGKNAAESMRAGMLHFSFDDVTSAVTVGDLCNAGYEWAAWSSSRVSVTVAGDGEVVCELRWGWPHARRGEINLSVTAPAGIHARVDRLDASAALPPGRFFAYAATHESEKPLVHTWADVEGDGRLAALYLAAEGSEDTHNLVPDPLNFLEGDETMIADGVVVARGTGTEDFFNGGFYFKDGPYGAPWGGVSVVGVQANDWGRAQMARYFLGADQLRFRESFRATIEVGVNHPDIPHRYRSLAIFYVRPPAP